jgi:DNA-binding NtrC family response regulator
MLIVPALNVEHDSSGARGNSPATIFVVDDEQMVLDLAAMFLQPLGLNVRTFNDPRKALKAFPTAMPALVITDYAMGDMTGIDLVRECRRVNPGQKVLLMSGTVDESMFAGESVKPDRFLAKPFQMSEFLEAVRTLTKV